MSLANKAKALSAHGTREKHCWNFAGEGLPKDDEGDLSTFNTTQPGNLNRNLEAVLKFEMARRRTDTKRIPSLLLSQLEMLPAGSWQEVPQTYEWFEWFERFVFAHIRTFSFAHSNVKATLPKACTNPFKHKLLRRTRHASIRWWPPIHKIPLRNLQGFMPTNPKKNREKRRRGKKKRLVSDRNSGIQSDPSGMLGIHIQHQIQYSSI